MSLKDLKDQNDTLKGAAWDYAATIERLLALLAEVGEPNDDEGCVYCEQPLLYNGMKHLPTCLTVRIKAELAGGGA